MDPLTDVLDDVRARGAVFNQSFLSGTWAVRFLNGSPLALVAPLEGACWIVPDKGTPVRLEPGDVAVRAGGEPYVVGDDPGTEPDVVVHATDRCTTADGAEMPPASGAGVRTWGEPAPGATRLVSGVYTRDGDVSGRLLSVLPELTVVGEVLSACPLDLAALDGGGPAEPGQQALFDRTLDLLLVVALRTWFTRPDARQPTWYRAYGDPVVGPALRLLHADPAAAWTVAGLAARTGVSRASLARRFTSLVGQPPMTYLRQWRLALAADLLRAPDATVGSVAARVGFASAFGLSAAFTRDRGVSPSAHRAGPTAPRAGDAREHGGQRPGGPGTPAVSGAG